MTKITKLYRLLPVILILLATKANAQMAEYNMGNFWVYATQQKSVLMDFVNSSTGVFMNNGTTYYLGNFQNDGTVGYDNALTVNPGLSSFAGTSAQTISGSGATSFYYLQFAGTAFSVQQPVSVVNQLDLSNGIVTAQQTTLQTVMNELQMSAGSSWVNASSASFVDGFVQKAGNTAFTFPIGNSGYYRPLTLAAPSSVTDAFTARYIYADPTAGGYSRTAKASGVGEVSNKEYWIVQRTTGTSSPQVTLGWDSSTSAAVPSNLSRLQVVRWDGSQWINEGNASTTGNATAGTITADMTGYGVITLAVKNAAKQLAVKAFLQGIWSSSTLKMNQCLTDDGVTPQFTTAVDAVSVELHKASDYSTIIYTASGLMLEPDGTIHTSGSSAVDIPGTYTGNYYITIKTRNHVETTSASALSFAADNISYDFTTADSQAYGSNQVKLKTGVYGVYAGDITGKTSTQDQMVNGRDVSQVFSQANLSTAGYAKEDMNGDGMVNGRDINRVFTNANLSIYAILP